MSKKNRNRENEVIVEATSTEQEVVVEAKTAPIVVEAVTGIFGKDIVALGSRDFVTIEALAKNMLDKYTEAGITHNVKKRMITETTLKNYVKGLLRICKQNKEGKLSKNDKRFATLDVETKVENNVVLVKFTTKQKDVIAESLETGIVVTE